MPQSEADDLDRFIEEMEQGLAFDKNDLDTAQEQHSEFYYRVSERLSLAKSRMDTAKQIVDEIEATVQLRIRREAERTSTKMTEATIAATVQLDSEVREAHGILLQHKDVVGRLSALLDAYGQRSHRLHDMTELYVAGYFGDASIRRGQDDILTARTEAIKRKRLP
jgi:hypothetical protein